MNIVVLHALINLVLGLIVWFGGFSLGVSYGLKMAKKEKRNRDNPE